MANEISMMKRNFKGTHDTKRGLDRSVGLRLVELENLGGGGRKRRGLGQCLVMMGEREMDDCKSRSGNEKGGRMRA